MNTAIMPRFAELAERAKHRLYICTDPKCLMCRDMPEPHVHEMYALPYRGRKVSITITGKLYSARIDDNEWQTCLKVSKAQAFAFVEEMTR